MKEVTSYTTWPIASWRVSLSLSSCHNQLKTVSVSPTRDRTWVAVVTQVTTTDNAVTVGITCRKCNNSSPLLQQMLKLLSSWSNALGNAVYARVYYYLEFFPEIAGTRRCITVSVHKSPTVDRTITLYLSEIKLNSHFWEHDYSGRTFRPNYLT